MQPLDIASWIGAIVGIGGSLWYFWLCSRYVADLCQTCTEAIHQEQEASHHEPYILVQATPDMSAAQLAALLQDAEAIIQAQQATTVQS